MSEWMKPEGEVEVIRVADVALEAAGNTCAVERRAVEFSCAALETAGDTGTV